MLEMKKIFFHCDIPAWMSVVLAIMLHGLLGGRGDLKMDSYTLQGTRVFTGRAVAIIAHSVPASTTAPPCFEPKRRFAQAFYN